MSTLCKTFRPRIVPSYLFPLDSNTYTYDWGFLVGSILTLRGVKQHEGNSQCFHGRKEIIAGKTKKVSNGGGGIENILQQTIKHFYRCGNILLKNPTLHSDDNKPSNPYVLQPHLKQQRKTHNKMAGLCGTYHDIWQHSLFIIAINHHS